MLGLQSENLPQNRQQQQQQQKTKTEVEKNHNSNGRKRIPESYPLQKTGLI